MAEASKSNGTRVRKVLTTVLFLAGGILCIMSLAADWVGLDLTPGFGVVQMLQLLLGLASLTMAVFLYLKSLRPPNMHRSLQADIGVRLAATGLVFAFVSGLSDLIGIGTHVTPNFDRPYVGPLQLGGLLVGVGSIIAGMLLYHTSRGSRENSLMGFLLKE